MGKPPSCVHVEQWYEVFVAVIRASCWGRLPPAPVNQIRP